MFPPIGEAWWSIYAKEVTRRRFAQSVHVIVRAEKRGLPDECHAGLLGYLPCDRSHEILVWFDATCRHLRPGLRVVSVLEDEKLPSALDVDDDPLTTLHTGIVKAAI